MMDAKTLEKYAGLLINFALNSGKGICKGDTVMVAGDDVAKPLILELHKSVLKAGANPIVRMMPSGMQKAFFQIANDEQLKYLPEKMVRARVDTIDHQVSIVAESDPKELAGIEPARIFKALEAKKKVHKWLEKKESAGEFTWTVAVYPTAAMANEAKMSLKEFCDVVKRACYLDRKDPVTEWRKIRAEQERVKKKLNALKIEYLHIAGDGIDLKVGIGRKRKWLGGSGRNIPSYEIFVSPDFTQTTGKISFNQPVYRYGNIMEGIELEFVNGVVVLAKARNGKKMLNELLKRKNANRIGEFSLTDRRLSRIDRFTANTLYDENVGGRYGNCHIALGNAYKDSYTGNALKVKPRDWEKLGFNESPEHTDIVSTARKNVHAYLKDGKKILIYKDGEFKI